MAKEKEKSVSVLLTTNNYSELQVHYLPQLCAHMEECGKGITNYEIVVSEVQTEDLPDKEAVVVEVDSGMPNVRLLHTKPGLGMVENLNRAIFAATMNYVLIMSDNVLPTFNYFSELLELFHYVPSLFGVSGNTLRSGDINSGNRVKTIDASTKDIHVVSVPVSGRKPVYTLAFANTNMLIDRRELCMLGGFCDLYTRMEDAIDEACIRAWRGGRKCVFRTTASCKQLAVDNQPVEDVTSADDEVNAAYDYLLTNYFHTDRMGHLRFWLKLLWNRFNVMASSADPNRQVMSAAYKRFFHNYRPSHFFRVGQIIQRNVTFERIARGYFSGQPQELNITKD